jgi:hypothetical protein
VNAESSSPPEVSNRSATLQLASELPVVTSGIVAVASTLQNLRESGRNRREKSF